MNVASQWKNQWHEPLTRKLEIINCSTILVHCDCNNMLKHASVHCDCNHLAATSLTIERPLNFTFSICARQINGLTSKHYQLDPLISRKPMMIGGPWAGTIGASIFLSNDVCIIGRAMHAFPFIQTLAQMLFSSFILSCT